MEIHEARRHYGAADIDHACRRSESPVRYARWYRRAPRDPRVTTGCPCRMMCALRSTQVVWFFLDLVLRNARIVDGTGSPWYRADLAVRGDTIARIAPVITGPAARVIDVGGAVVAPGFVDLHTHAVRGIFQVPTADNYVRQGVTTIMEGPDGGSPVPLKPFLDKLDALPKSLNIGSFIGQGSVRQAVVGFANRNPTPEEMERMRGLVRQGMEDGAFGLSTGLFYVPGAYTPLAEVVELQKVARRSAACIPRTCATRPAASWTA